MLSEYYWIAITLTVISFTSINLFSKAFLNRKNSILSYKSFLPFYLAFSSAMVIVVSLIITHNLYIGDSEIAYAALMGFIYAVAAYMVFYSLENEQVVVITAINASQFIILSFASVILFVHSFLLKDFLPMALMLVGIVLLTVNKTRKRNISIFAFLAFLGTVVWVIMWLIFYSTIQTGTSPFVYYAWLTIFAAAFSIVFSLVLKVKQKNLRGTIKSKRLFGYVLSAGLFNGLGSVMFSFAYSTNTVISPLLTQVSIPSIAVLAFLFLKERVRLAEALGAAAIIVSVFIIVLA